jgi:hypothetical protein
METTNTRTLARKLATIMGKLGALPRTGEKKGQTRAGGEFSYDVFLESDILQPVQKALAAHGIIIIPKCVAVDRHVMAGKPNEAPRTLVDVLVEYIVCDSESDEKLTGQMSGSAAEMGDGTGVSKAVTDSNKNFLRKLFELTADEGQQGRRTANKPASQPSTAPKPQATTTTGENEVQRLSECQVTEINEATKDGRKYFWVRIVHAGKVINAIADDPKVFPSVRVGKGEVHLSKHDGWRYARVTYAALEVVK